MKQVFKIIQITAFFLLVTSCINQSEKKENKLEVKEAIETSKKNEDVLNNDWMDDIVLDNDVKWNANIETTQGVIAMLKLINESHLKTVDDYHVLANNLNTIKNTVVKECTMKGASHDNLHIFLHPLIEKINHLLKVTSTEEGVLTKESIKENLTAYKNYFQ